MPTYRHQYKFSLTIKHKFTTLAFVKWQLLTKKRKILQFIHSALNIKRTKCVSLVTYVFALNFLSMQICKSQKQDKCHYKFSSLAYFKFTTAFYEQAFLTKKPKILNFICHLKRGRDCFFITLYRFLPNTKNHPLREI